MMKFIVLLCFASVGVNAAWLRRQETLSSNDLSENTGTDKADSHAEANSTSGADQEEAVEATEEFFNGGFGNPGRKKSGKYGVSRPKNESMLRSNKGDGFEQGAGSSSAVNNRVSLCLNGEDCGKKEEEKPQTSAAPEPEAETEEPQPEEPEPEAPTDPALLLAQNCARWASDDQCNKNPAYMLQKCSQQCDEWCDETTCDQRILAHWRKCLDYARGGACYSNTGYMKTACNAFCPKNTYPPDGFSKHGGPNHQTGQPLQVPVQEPAYVHPGVQLDPNWNPAHPLWSSQAGASATSGDLADAVAEAGGAVPRPETGPGGVLPKTPAAAPRPRLPGPQQDDPSALPVPPPSAEEPAVPGESMSLVKPRTAKLRRRPPAAAPQPHSPRQPPQPTAAHDSRDVVVLHGKPRATQRDGGQQAPPDAPHGGRRSRIGAMLADKSTINFTMDIALSPADLNNVQSLVNYAKLPARHALEASLRGMIAARLAQRESGLKVIAKNVQITGMEMRRLVHSSKNAIPSVLHVSAAILSPLVKAGLVGKDTLTLLGKRMGKKLLEDAFKVAGTPVRITNYYVGL